MKPNFLDRRALFSLSAAFAAFAVFPSAAFAAETGFLGVYDDRAQGRITTSGERYEPGLLTAAHASLPIGTFVRVANFDSGKMLDVRINDRKAVDERLLYLSRRAADEIGLSSNHAARGSLVVIEAIPAIAPVPARLEPDAREKRAKEGEEEKGWKPLGVFSKKEAAPERADYVTGGVMVPLSAGGAGTSGTRREAVPVTSGSPAPTLARESSPYPYRVQFGAFKRERNAQDLVHSLTSAGVPAVVVQSSANSLFLVITGGGFVTADEAQRWIDVEGSRRSWTERPVVIR